MANRVMEWIDARFPLTAFLHHALMDYPTPKNLSYWWNFGFLAGFVLVLQIISGIFLAMHYEPTTSGAFDSVQRIMREVNYGWLIRNIHATGASAFFIVVYIHMARTLFYGSYRAPRELVWWIGQVILILMMATAFMGYLLPWGQMSYWGAEVITNLFRATPVIGEELVYWIRGDFGVGDTTLKRFFALHYLLPFLIVAVVILHLIGLHQVRSSNPSGINLAARDNIPFHPYFTVKDFFGLGVFLIVFSVFVFLLPEFFLSPINNNPANPLQTPPHIVPEWYFLPFYAILRAIPDTLGGAMAMTISVIIFALLPFLDRSRIPGGALYRPVYGTLYYIFIIDVFVLAYIGAKPPESAWIVAGRIATFIYFAVFLVLPFVSKWEERWLLKRGLPPEVMEMVHAEERDKAARERAHA